MLTLALYGLLAIGVISGLFMLAVRVLPAGEQIAPPIRDEAIWAMPADRALTATDVAEVRLPVALRGYRFAETDLLLDRLADELRARDEQIARLRGETPVADGADIAGDEPRTGAPKASATERPAAGVPASGAAGPGTPGADTPGADTPGADTEGADTPGADTEGAETEGAETPGAESAAPSSYWGGTARAAGPKVRTAPPSPEPIAPAGPAGEQPGAFWGQGPPGAAPPPAGGQPAPSSPAPSRPAAVRQPASESELAATWWQQPPAGAAPPDEPEPRTPDENDG